MRVLPFTKYSPCGNTTILVRESSLSPADRARVAAEIIAPGHLEAEQAGYVDTAAPVPRLDMMGGEFCVNATRAFAALLAEEGKLSPESGGLGGIDALERLDLRRAGLVYLGDVFQFQHGWDAPLYGCRVSQRPF